MQPTPEFPSATNAGNFGTEEIQFPEVSFAEEGFEPEQKDKKKKDKKDKSDKRGKKEKQKEKSNEETFGGEQPMFGQDGLSWGEAGIEDNEESKNTWPSFGNEDAMSFGLGFEGDGETGDKPEKGEKSKAKKSKKDLPSWEAPRTDPAVNGVHYSFADQTIGSKIESIALPQPRTRFGLPVDLRSGDVDRRDDYAARLQDILGSSGSAEMNSVPKRICSEHNEHTSGYAGRRNDGHFEECRIFFCWVLQWMASTILSMAKGGC